MKLIRIKSISYLLRKLSTSEPTKSTNRDVDSDGIHDVLIGSDSNGWLLYGSNERLAAHVDLSHANSYEGAELGKPSAAGDINNDGHNDILTPSRLYYGRSRLPTDIVIGQGDPDQSVRLEANTTMTFQVSGIVRSDISGVLQLSASALSNNIVDQNPDNNTATLTSTVHRDVDLVTDSSGPALASRGETILLEFSVENLGYQSAVGTRAIIGLSDFLQDPTWVRETSKTVPPLEINNPQGIDLGNTSIVSAGDFNGDGLTDLVTLVEQEMVVILGENTDPPRIRFTSVKHLDRVQPAGDLNGDGLPDLLVRSQDRTMHFVVFGDVTPEGVALDQLDGNSGFRITNAGEPLEVSPVGDVNGDGYDDWSVTRTDDSPALIQPGKAQFNSNLDLDSMEIGDALRVLAGKQASSYWHTIAPAGDVNGDGVGDLLVGLGLDIAGEAFVIYGKRASGLETDVRQIETSDGFFVGHGQGRMSIGPAGDLNGDGFDDVVASFDGDAPQDFTSYEAVFAMGSADLAESGNTKRVITSIGFPGLFQAGSAGDINADGFDDVFVGQFHLFGSIGFAEASTNFQTLTTSEAHVGEPLRNVGDFNGDGINDYLVDEAFLQFGQEIVNSNEGTGDIDEVVDLAPLERLAYRITGVVSADAQPGPMQSSLAATVGLLRTDVQPINNSTTVQTTVHRELLGDVDGNRVVDFADFLILSANFGKRGAVPADGDIDGNATVDFADFLVLSQDFGRRGE